MVPEGPEPRAGVHIPNLCSSIGARRRDPAPVRTPGETEYLCRMLRQRFEQLTIRIPQLDGIVIASSCDNVPCGIPGNEPDVGSMPSQCLDRWLRVVMTTRRRFGMPISLLRW